MTEIIHEEGYKDEYKVTVKNQDVEWSPTNQQLFTLVEKMFESEEHEFEDGYGCRWLWFYMSTIMLGKPGKAKEAYGLRGKNALKHFEETVKEHGDEVIKVVEELQDEVQ